MKKLLIFSAFLIFANSAQAGFSRAGDNLGNHVAVRRLDLNQLPIIGVSTITAGSSLLGKMEHVTGFSGIFISSKAGDGGYPKNKLFFWSQGTEQIVLETSGESGSDDWSQMTMRGGAGVGIVLRSTQNNVGNYSYLGLADYAGVFKTSIFGDGRIYLTDGYVDVSTIQAKSIIYIGGGTSSPTITAVDRFTMRLNQMLSIDQSHVTQDKLVFGRVAVDVSTWVHDTGGDWLHSKGWNIAKVNSITFTDDTVLTSTNQFYTGGGGGYWVATATNNLNMDGYDIYGVNSITASSMTSQNGLRLSGGGLLLPDNTVLTSTNQFYTGGGGGYWVATATNNLNMNGYDIYGVDSITASSMTSQNGLRLSGGGLLLPDNTVLTSTNQFNTGGGSGGSYWVATATNNLNMDGYNIQGVSSITTAGSVLVGGSAYISNNVTASSLSISGNGHIGGVDGFRVLNGSVSIGGNGLFTGIKFSVINGIFSVGFNNTNRISLYNSAGNNYIDSTADSTPFGGIALRVNQAQQVYISSYNVVISSPLTISHGGINQMQGSLNVKDTLYIGGGTSSPTITAVDRFTMRLNQMVWIDQSHATQDKIVIGRVGVDVSTWMHDTGGDWLQSKGWNIAKVNSLTFTDDTVLSSTGIIDRVIHEPLQAIPTPYAYAVMPTSAVPVGSPKSYSWTISTITVTCVGGTSVAGKFIYRNIDSLSTSTNVWSSDVTVTTGGGWKGGAFASSGVIPANCIVYWIPASVPVGAVDWVYIRQTWQRN